MKNARFLAIGSALFLAACQDTTTAGSNPNAGFIPELPERVVSIAADNQDLKAVRLDPNDGCYVYRYAGPVETTFLPLRAINGRPICTR